MRRGTGTRYAYHEDTLNWEKGWAILASMKGLEKLTVELTDPSAHGLWESNWLELEETILQPLKNVRVKDFEVVLPYQRCSVDKDMGNCAVRFRRPNENEEEDRP